MNEKMSMTAEVAAFVRAYHTAESGTICSDPLAIKLLGEKRYGQKIGRASCRERV